MDEPVRTVTTGYDPSRVVCGGEECRPKHPDTLRLEKLARMMARTASYRDKGLYEFPDVLNLIESARETCTYADLCAAIDAMETPHA